MILEVGVVLDARLAADDLQLHHRIGYGNHSTLAAHHEPVVHIQTAFLEGSHLLLHVEAVNVMEEQLVLVYRHGERNVVGVRA